MKNTTRNSIALAAGALALLGMSGMAQATDLTTFKTVFDTDFTTAGNGGMRDLGTGTVSLSGVTGTVTEAYLYWHGPTNASPADGPTANADVNFNGTDVTGTFLGISDDNCWGFQNSMAYRADVSSLVTGDGNYTLANFTKPNGINVNGVSLIVFFDDGDDTNNRDVVMFDGNDSNITNAFDADGWNASLPGINYTSGSANMQLHVSDGQSFLDEEFQVNGTTIAGDGAVFQGIPDARVSTSGGGPTNGSLWDIKDYDVTSLLSPGNNDLTLSTFDSPAGDCLACILVAIDLPAGAAPDQPDDPTPGVPAPGTLALLGLGLAGLSRMRRSAK